MDYLGFAEFKYPFRVHRLNHEDETFVRVGCLGDRGLILRNPPFSVSARDLSGSKVDSIYFSSSAHICSLCEPG